MTSNNSSWIVSVPLVFDIARNKIEKKKQECIPVGCVPLASCPYLPACTAPGVGGLPARGVYLPRGCTCVRGVPARGVYSPLCTEFLTHATENITLPQTSFAGGKNYDHSLRYTTDDVIPSVDIHIKHGCSITLQCEVLANTEMANAQKS